MDKNRRYFSSAADNCIMSVVKKGVFSAKNQGYGFIPAEEKGEPDVYIPVDNVNGALHSDVVEYRLRMRNARPEGTVTRILSRGHTLIAGTFYAEEKNEGYIVALDSKFPYAFTVPPAAIKRLGLVDGHRVMFKVLLDGKIVVSEIYGHKNDVGIDVLNIVKQFGAPTEFSKNSIKESDDIPDSVTESSLEGREDYRSWYIVTIDGSDTKDIDDAVSLRILPNGNFELGVHIADVSHYVQPGSALDNDARARGTSIYLADRVIPMLPEKLSNGVCSLNPNVDRLTLSCIMEIDKSGDLISHKISPSVIRSQKRYTYDEVLELLNEGKTEFINDLNKLAVILRDKRIKRGALKFNSKEAKVILDKRGIPTDIIARQANAATSIIEELMIVCNETVAGQFEDKPFVFRIHEPPDVNKMHALASYARNFGHNLFVSEKGVSAKELQKLVMQMNPALEPVILRSLNQARYTMENKGHFGLALSHYCHFTSPIRRYPDLLVHRAIKTGLKKRGLNSICEHCSNTERNADSIERTVLQLKKCQYLADKIGQEYTGIVCGVFPWGLFIKLPNTIEGFVPLEFLVDDKYRFVERQMAFYGLRRKKKIALGNTFKAILINVDVAERKITFAPK